jgi:transcriptional regulator with XRE-family HTH domain
MTDTQGPFHPQVLFSLCDAAGVRSVDIARRLGVTRAAVAQWRSGVRTLSPDHYAELVRIATSPGTLWLATHHAIEGKEPPEGLVSDTRLIFKTSRDYINKMIKEFRAALTQVSDLATGDPATWNYAGLSAGTQALAEMANALKVIMEPDQKKEVLNAPVLPQRQAVPDKHCHRRRRVRDTGTSRAQ